MADTVRVLWLDSDVAAVSEYSRALFSRGWAVDIARTTREAAALAEAYTYHVAIIDVVLPDGMGTEAWTRLKARQPELVGIMTTSSRSLRASIQPFSPGILTYLLKPLPMDAICGMIATIFEYQELALDAQRAGKQLIMLGGLLAGLRLAATPGDVLDVAISQIRAMLQPDWVMAFPMVAGRSAGAHQSTREPSPAQRPWTPAQSALVERLTADTLRNQEALIISESHPLSAFHDDSSPRAVGMGALVIVPLVTRDRAHGAIVVANALPSAREFTAAEIEALVSACQATSLALDSASRNAAFDEQVIDDQASGVYSSVYLENVLAMESARQTRDPRPYSLIKVDWTGVRQACEAQGPEVAAGALRAWGGLARQIVRKSDVVARRARDEFAVLLPNTDYAQAQQVASRIGAHAQARLPGELATAYSAMKFSVVTYAPSPKGTPGETPGELQHA